MARRRAISVPSETADGMVSAFVRNPTLFLLMFGSFLAIVIIAIVNKPGPVPPTLVNPYLASNTDWPSHGRDARNTHHNADETRITVANVENVALKWAYEARGDVLALATIADGVIYFPDSAGYVYALNSSTAALLWNTSLPDETGLDDVFSRTAPTVADADTLVVGSATSGHLFILARADGALLHTVHLETHGSARITGAATVAEGVIYQGVDSEEGAIAAADTNYVCCTFRGSVSAINLTTAEVMWTTYMVPTNNGTNWTYAGGAVAGNSLPIDLVAGALYVTTGKTFVVPLTVQTCLGSASTTSAENACYSSTVYADSILSLDITTGAINWAYKSRAIGSKAAACSPTPTFAHHPTCPGSPSQATSFSQAPVLVRFNASLSYLCAGQQSAIYTCVKPSDGTRVYAHYVGGSGSNGGFRRECATDDATIYCAVTNTDHETVALFPNQLLSTTGSYMLAMDALSGDLLWAVPELSMDSNTTRNTLVGPTTLANGVVFAASFDSAGTLYARDSATGELRWTYHLGASAVTAPTISDGSLYIGMGAQADGGTNATAVDNAFIAFQLPQSFSV